MDSNSCIPMLLPLLVLGFCGMVGRAARAGFAPCGTGGLGFTGPAGEVEEDVALRRAAGSSLVSLRAEVFSEAKALALLVEQLEVLVSVVEDWGLAANTYKMTKKKDKTKKLCCMYQRKKI